MGHWLEGLVDTGKCPLILHEDKGSLGGIELEFKVFGELVD